MLVLCAVAVAAGVLSMHVLVGNALPSGGDGVAHTPPVAAPHAVDAGPDTEVDHGEQGTHHGLVDVCLALVVALGVMMLAVQAARVGLPARLVDRTGLTARRLTSRAVARAGPDLHALSILRC